MRRQLALLIFAVCVPGFCGGCVALLAGGAAGAAGYAYVKAKQERHYSQPVEATADAARRALADLGLAATSEQGDGLGTVIRTQSAAGKRIKLQIEPVGSGSTVAVRVGAFGDDTLTEQLFQRIDQQLGMSQPEVGHSGVAPASASDASAGSSSVKAAK